VLLASVSVVFSNANVQQRTALLAKINDFFPLLIKLAFGYFIYTITFAKILKVCFGH